MQYDVYQLAGGQLVLDLQSDLVDVGTRVVAPLVDKPRAATRLPTLEPVLFADGQELTLLVTEMTAIPARLLGRPITNLKAHDYTVRRAIDLIFTGV